MFLTETIFKLCSIKSYPNVCFLIVCRVQRVTWGYQESADLQDLKWAQSKQTNLAKQTRLYSCYSVYTCFNVCLHACLFSLFVCVHAGWKRRAGVYDRSRRIHGVGPCWTQRRQGYIRCHSVFTYCCVKQGCWVFVRISTNSLVWNESKLFQSKRTNQCESVVVAGWLWRRWTCWSSSKYTWTIGK